MEFVLGRRLLEEPGASFNYNTGASHLLSVIITRATGQDTYSFARENLFSPIGIGEVEWRTDPQGYYAGGTDLWMCAEDLARFGLLYLHNGRWDEEQIIPADWVELSTTSHSKGSRIGGGQYGFQWWTTSLLVGTEFVECFYGWALRASISTWFPNMI
ncbi:MAG: serine hydrolase [Firmicutes bacterium]|nr:serine hydrolase [Bacillota bacterium]